MERSYPPIKEHAMSLRPFRRTDDFDPSLFRAPKAIDRGAPFWSWNGRLDRDRLLRQLDVFGEMGLGGAHIHPRTGLTTPYLGPDFLDLVRTVVEHAERRQMHAWLYDEDRWPSGFAGGIATTNKKFRLRHLRLSRTPIAEGETRPCPTHHGAPLPLSKRRFVASWGLTFRRGLLADRRRVSEGETPSTKETLLFAYLEVPPAWTWFNNTQYVDTLNPEAMRLFIETTHERYAKAVGDRFGTVIPAIFTDEPLFRGMDLPHGADDDRDIFLSWTDDLPETYAAAYDEDLLDVLPDVLYDRADGRHTLARWRFHNHHTDRFSQAFAGQIGEWCSAHGIALTGHMMAEDSLESQTTWVGEAMRSLRHFQLPGIDMLCDQVELTTAKQAQSAARQNGAPGTMSELYGVTNWDFPFAGHKRQGDWQAALGVVTRVQHLTWYQMDGEAKRDYPASIGEHSPWWRRYRVIEDHFARLNVALKSGRPHCRVAMIHPVESYWLVHGPSTAAHERARLEEGFSQTLSWLLEDLIDVDFVSEASLEEQARPTQEAGAQPDIAKFFVGEMAYEAVVVPPSVTLRSSTIAALGEFAKAGGTVVLMDGGPSLVDASRAATADDLDRFTPIGAQRSALLEAVEPFRDVRLQHADGRSPGGVVHQVRALPDGGRIVFIARFNRDPYSRLEGARLSLRGEWRVTELCTEDGSERPVAAEVDSEWTHLQVDLPIAGHILLRTHQQAQVSTDNAPSEAGATESATEVSNLAPSIRRTVEVSRLSDPSDIAVEEDNVLVLDRGEWRLDDGEWRSVDEVLRIDNAARAALGMPERSGHIAQPWVEPARKGSHRVTIGFSIEVTFPTGSTRLAIEDSDTARVVLDGREIAKTPDGEWIDIAFTPLALPPLEVGTHRLEVTWPFGGSEELEACYLLGDFGVNVSGTKATITAPVRSLTWGDATVQGLAFYGGNIRYRCSVELPTGRNRLIRIPHIAGALVDVCWPGADPIPVYREPWLAPVPDQLAGTVTVELVAYGTRINTFGQLHIVAEGYRWWGPQSWRTEGVQWADEYQLHKNGILSAPAICRSCDACDAQG